MDLLYLRFATKLVASMMFLGYVWSSRMVVYIIDRSLKLIVSRFRVGKHGDPRKDSYNFLYDWLGIVSHLPPWHLSASKNAFPILKNMSFLAFALLPFK